MFEKKYVPKAWVFWIFISPNPVWTYNKPVCVSIICMCIKSIFYELDEKRLHSNQQMFFFMKKKMQREKGYVNKHMVCFRNTLRLMKCFPTTFSTFFIISRNPFLLPTFVSLLIDHIIRVSSQHLCLFFFSILLSWNALYLCNENYDWKNQLYFRMSSKIQRNLWILTKNLFSN